MTGAGTLESPTGLARDLSSLFNPRSIAIAGASDTPGKFGFEVARRALAGEHRRRIFLMNQRAATVAGRSAFASFSDLDEAPELVVLATPAATVSTVVDEALAAGARAFLGLTSGIPQDVERRLARTIADAGAVLLGPNCIGIADAESELDLYGWGRFDAGPVAVLSHSGALGMDIGRGVTDAGLGVSRIVSMGNCADIQPADLIRSLIGHGPTKVIAVYCESPGDGRDFLRAAAEARESGTPVVALVAEPTEATSRAAMTHTRALLSDGRVVRSAYQEAGIVQVDSIGHLLEAVRALASPRPPRGRRVGVISEGGGPGIMGADAMARAGLDVPEFSTELQRRLGDLVNDDMGSARNPVDTGTGGTVATICAAAEIVAMSGEVDAVVITGLGSTADFFIAESDRPRTTDRGSLGLMPDSEGLVAWREAAERDHEAARRLVTALGGTDIALYGAFFETSLPTALTLNEGGCPVFRSVDAAARAVSLGIRAVGARGIIPCVPEPGAGLAADDYFAARQFLADSGLPFARAGVVSSLEESLALAQEIGFPVVLKALGTMHKSDRGGVALGLASVADVQHAFHGMRHLEAATYSVEEMVDLSQGVELILGAQRDHQYGPVVLVGMGGIYSELLHDVAVALAPLDVDSAEALIRTLRGASLLTGHRGRPPLSVRAAAEALAVVSNVIARTPAISEIEVNPLLVLPDRALGLDARAVL